MVDSINAVATVATDVGSYGIVAEATELREFCNTARSAVQVAASTILKKLEGTQPGQLLGYTRGMAIVNGSRSIAGDALKLLVKASKASMAAGKLESDANDPEKFQKLKIHKVVPKETTVNVVNADGTTTEVTNVKTFAVRVNWKSMDAETGKLVNRTKKLPVNGKQYQLIQQRMPKPDEQIGPMNAQLLRHVLADFECDDVSSYLVSSVQTNGKCVEYTILPDCDSFQVKERKWIQAEGKVVMATADVKETKYTV